jgi:hypothetical protein
MATNTKALSLPAASKAAALERCKQLSQTAMHGGKSHAGRSGNGRRAIVRAALEAQTDKQLAAVADASPEALRAYVCRILASAGSLRVSEQVALDTWNACIAEADTEAPCMPSPVRVQRLAASILAARAKAKADAEKADKPEPATA